MRNTFRALPIIALASLLACSGSDDAPSAPAAVAAPIDFIEGRVSNAAGAPEAGVWVIAETTEASGVSPWTPGDVTAPRT